MKTNEKYISVVLFDPQYLAERKPNARYSILVKIALNLTSFRVLRQDRYFFSVSRISLATWYLFSAANKHRQVGNIPKNVIFLVSPSGPIIPRVHHLKHCWFQEATEFRQCKKEQLFNVNYVMSIGQFVLHADFLVSTRCLHVHYKGGCRSSNSPFLVQTACEDKKISP